MVRRESASNAEIRSQLPVLRHHALSGDRRGWRDHSESRSLTGVSLIKIYFKPGSDANAALSNIANLAMADLRHLPPGTLPPVVLKFDASSLPVCLVTLKGQGLNETRL